MNDKTKKRLVIASSLVVCAALVVLIGSRFVSAKPVDQPVSSSKSTQTSDVTVNTDTKNAKEAVVITPDISETTATSSAAVSTGTQQTIQSDVSKPAHTQDQLTDSSQKPTTKSATATTKAATSSTQKTTTSSSGTSSSSGGLPGFDNVPNLGENQGGTVDGEGDINKQVGTMN